MASTSETGHAKNVATFEDLISFCASYGSTYNPSRAILQIAALNNQLTAVREALQAVKAYKTAYDNATNGREIAMEPFKTLTTRILNALMATEATPQTIDDARTIANKIRGTKKSKAAPKATAESTTPAAKTISTSQQSYDKLVDHFAQLIVVLSAEPSYQPNENELKLTTLNALHTDLTTRNTNVGNAWASLSNARLNRYKMLYGEGMGMVDVATAVKNYVRSIYGSSSPQFKQVSGLRFTRPPGD